VFSARKLLPFEIITLSPGFAEFLHRFLSCPN
jgi:hypothetical protein